LESPKSLGIPVKLAWGDSIGHAIRSQGAGGFANNPFDWVQPIGAVREVRDTDVLAGRKQVGNISWNQRPEGDLEWTSFHEPAWLRGTASMNIQPVVADSARIREVLCPNAGLKLSNNILFVHRR